MNLTGFTCPCGSSNITYHDGLLGYEAIRCKDCGTETDLNAKETPTMDVQITGSNCFYQFALLTPEAQDWAKQYIDPSVMNGNGTAFYCDDTRYAMDIAEEMQNDGLKVQ